MSSHPFSVRPRFPALRICATGRADSPLQHGLARGPWRQDRGTTLLEIVLAMAIMTVGMLGYFTLHIRSLALASGSESISQATAVAVALQDQLLTIPFEEEIANDGSTAWLFADCGPVPTDSLADLCHSAGAVSVFGKTASGTQAAYYRTWHVTHVAGRATNLPQLLVTVRVRYAAEDGRCPSCSSYTRGWKAITTSVMRSQTAY